MKKAAEERIAAEKKKKVEQESKDRDFRRFQERALGRCRRRGPARIIGGERRCDKKGCCGGAPAGSSLVRPGSNLNDHDFKRIHDVM